ncbi:MAG TPA: hypothetical protein PK640_20165, partial [Verrucomicrobiota bacterium]|nr:hypothetical protein [Verrucomicrobiota bacterium]
MTHWIRAGIAVLLVVSTLGTRAVTVSGDELLDARQWVAARFQGRAPAPAPDPGTGLAVDASSTKNARGGQRLSFFTTDPPFSFVYDGRPSAETIASWQRVLHSRILDDQRTEHTLSFTDPKTGLELRCVAIEYRDFPTIEWTLHFRNTGTVDTPILEQIQPLDAQMDRGESGEFLLHHAVGSPADGNDYGPRETLLAPGTTCRIGAAGGRPTNTDWSYFNLEWPPGRGLIVVVGWPGQWAAEFARDAGRGLRLRAGQELTRFKLLPGEEIRTPLIVLQFWQGDWMRAQNVWRRWMMAHSMPKPG